MLSQKALSYFEPAERSVIEKVFFNVTVKLLCSDSE